MKVAIIYNQQDSDENTVIESVDSSKQYNISFNYDDSGYINGIKIDEQ